MKRFNVLHIIFGLSLVDFVLCTISTEKIERAAYECQSKIDPSEFSQMTLGLEMSHPLQCLAACIFETVNFTNSVGDINMDEVRREYSPDGKTAAQFKECAAKVKNIKDKCEKAKEIMECVEELDAQ